MDYVQRWVTEPPPDHLFEVSEHALAGASPRHPEQRREEVLREQGLVPSPVAPNVVKPILFRDALPRIAAAAAPKKKRSALIIPDYAVRMAVLDFEEFPASEQEQASLLRFRLRKSVPFPIDEAQLAYSVQINEPNKIEVLAVAIARPILNEYEQIFTDAGYQVGFVTPSSLAALALCARDASAMTLLAKAAGSTLTMFLVEQGRVRLVRCLDLAAVAEEEQQPGTDVIIPLLQQTRAYAEDELRRPVQQLLLCGFNGDAETLGRKLESTFSIPYSLVRSRFGAPTQGSAGLLGLLEQYAA